MGLTERICEIFDSDDLFDPNELPLARHARDHYIMAALATEIVLLEWQRDHPGEPISDGALFSTLKSAAQRSW